MTHSKRPPKKTMANADRSHNAQLVQSISIIAPAERIVGILVCSFGTQRLVEIYPVIALKTSLVDVYQSSGRRPPCGQNHVEMIQNGWLFEARQERHELMIYDEAFEIVEINEMIRDVSNGSHRVMNCSWPADQDEIRLAGLVAELEIEARNKVQAAKQNSLG